MDREDLCWEIFKTTGSIHAYLIHKNIQNGGKNVNAKGNRVDNKTNRVR